MGVFDELKSQSKEIEKELEWNLEQLSVINQSLHPDSLEVTTEKSPESSLISRSTILLNQLKDLLSSMQKSVQTPIEKSIVSSLTQSYSTSTKRLSDLKNSIQDKRWQQQLIGNQFSDIDYTKTEILLKEEKYLDESMELSKNILASAKEVRVSLAYQSQKLNSTQEKITKFAQMIPGIGFIMKRISARQQINAIVMGLAIAICLCILVYKVL